ncbi:MAG: SDR family NAD(P)-dependent oxidoreductase [Geminicoccaceae bacterium]
MNEDLQGRVAIVTGSALNIGRQTCLKLAELGAAVVTHAKENREGAEETAALVRAEGGRVATYVGDLSKPEGAMALIETALDHFGGLHLLVNNAAMRRNTSLAETSFEDWKAVQCTNLDAPFLCCQAAVPHMVAAGWGRIVMLGGLSAHRGVKDRVHVATTKAGLTGMTRALAAEFAHAGITANCVVPGSINTVRGAAAGAALHGGHPNLLNRKGEPDEVAHMIVSLCRPEAAYTTGQTIHVNGGAYLA